MRSTFGIKTPRGVTLLVAVVALLTSACGGSDKPETPEDPSLRAPALALQAAMATSARAIDGVRGTRESLERLAAALQPTAAQTGDAIGLLTAKATGPGPSTTMLGAAREQRTFLQLAIDASGARTRGAANSAMARARDAGRRASDQYAELAQLPEAGLAGLLPPSTTFNTGRLRDAVRTVNKPKPKDTQDGGDIPPAPTPDDNGGDSSVFVGRWTGEATQYAPSGSTQRVGLATTIDETGRRGTHSEFILNKNRTSDCRGVITRSSYGVYEYTETADSGCIARTRIVLTPDGDSALRFSETYFTKSGARGRVVGRLVRRR